MASRIGIGLIGCGTVGGATAKLILDQTAKIRERTGIELHLARVVDKDFTHARKLGIPETVLSTELSDALADPSINIIIELVGGTGFAKSVCEQALDAGKHVVTANKALLAKHGIELFARARQNKVCIGFEASCGGGIPLVRALYDGLAANSIDAIYGIVNGTCNYILSEMLSAGKSYAQALSDAQAAGFAEADPTLDITGGDSAHKLCILASMAFGGQIALEDIPAGGIDKLQAEDIGYGAELGYVVKLIASGVREKDGAFVRVEPVFVPQSHPLAWVSGSFNAVSVYGDSVGHTLYYGRGAGGSPTASAVVADLIAIGTGSYPILFEKLKTWPGSGGKLKLLPSGQSRRRFYLRFKVADKPGILGRIAAILAEKSVSLSAIRQPEVPENGVGGRSAVPIIITTHSVLEADIQAAVSQILALADVEADAAVLPILDEHEEFRGV